MKFIKLARSITAFIVLFKARPLVLVIISVAIGMEVAANETN